MYVDIGADVCLTDMPDVVSHLEANAALNSSLYSWNLAGEQRQQEKVQESERRVEGSLCMGKLRVAALRWGEPNSFCRGEFTVVFLSDCIYYEELFSPLLSSLLSLCSSTTRVLISQTPRRSNVEARFFKQLRKHFTIKLLGQIKEKEEDRQFVSLWEATLKSHG